MINKKELTFTLFNAGTPHHFSPFKTAICPYEKRKRSLLDIHRDFVAQRNSPSVFILDNTGLPLKN